MSNHYPERGRMARPDTRLQEMADATSRRQEKLAEQFLQDVKLGFDFPSKKMPRFLTLLIAESLGNENPAYIYATVCTAVAMATQGKVRINMPSGQTYNLNSFFYIIGPAASGKSVVIEKYLSPIHEIDDFRCHRHAENLALIKAEHSVLMLDKKKLSKEYQRLPDGEHKNELAEQLRKIEMQLSVKLPTHGSIIVNETTRAGIINRLKINAGSLALVSDEANRLCTYTIGSDPGLFNHLYDGRKHSKSTLDYADITFNQIHFCMLTAIQNSRAAKVFTTYGEDWIESGFTSRLLPVICTEADWIAQYQSTECGSNYFTEYKDKIKQIDALFQERELLAFHMNGSAIELMMSLINKLKQEWAERTKMISMLVRAEMHISKQAAIFMLLRNPHANTIEKKDIVAAYYAYAYHLKMHDILIRKESSYNYRGVIDDSKGVLLKITERAMENSGHAELTWLQARVTLSRRSKDALQPVLDYLLATKRIAKFTRNDKSGFKVVTNIQHLPPE